MSEMDDALQQRLEALENGADLDTALAGLDENSTEVASLLRLASAVRNMPHPEPLMESLAVQRQKVLAAARQITDPTPLGKFLGGFNLSNLLSSMKLRWALIPALAGGMLIFLCAVVTLVGFSMWSNGPRDAQAATLMDMRGHVEVVPKNTASDWHAVKNGDQVQSGWRIRTEAASSATLVFFDGSRTTLEPNSDVTLTRVDGDWGKVLRVVLTQNAGEISNSVVPLRGKNSSFLVYTPSGAASVHGTAFDVAVNPQGGARYAVDHGKVLVTNDQSEVYLLAGQVTTSQPGQELEAPAYQFSLEGLLSSSQGSTWIVSGVPFTVLTTTQVTGSPQLNSMVHVDGHILDTGEWIADTIAPAEGDESTASFTGTLYSMVGDTWQIGDWTVLVNADTELDEGLATGKPVRAWFTLTKDGHWLATRIEPLAVPEEEPTATPDPSAHPSLEFKPDELEMQTCKPGSNGEFALTGTLQNSADEQKDYAANVELGYQVIKGAEFVKNVELDPSSWQTIDAGEQVNFTIHIKIDSTYWDSAQEEAEVKVRVFITQETNNPDHQPGRLTATVEKNCGETEEPSATPTWTPTPTPTNTGTVTVTPTPTATPTPTPETSTTPEEINCTGAQPHPTGMRLADRFGVPYEEIMGWFCRGFGFGEINLAYTLSQQSGTPVADIFAMKSSGMGWGVIKKQLAPKTPNNKPPKKDK